MASLKGLKAWIDKKTDDNQNAVKGFFSKQFNTVNNYRNKQEDNLQDFVRMQSWKVPNALPFVDTSARIGAYKSLMDTRNGRSVAAPVGMPSPTPSSQPRPSATPIPDAAAKPRIGANKLTAGIPEEKLYSRVPDPKARELLKKYIDKYNVDPGVAIAVFGHETGNTFNPLQDEWGQNHTYYDSKTGKTKPRPAGRGMIQLTPPVNTRANSLYGTPAWDDPEAMTEASVQELLGFISSANQGGWAGQAQGELPVKYLRDIYRRINGGNGYAAIDSQQQRENAAKFQRYLESLVTQ